MFFKDTDSCALVPPRWKPFIQIPHSGLLTSFLYSVGKSLGRRQIYLFFPPRVFSLSLFPSLDPTVLFVYPNDALNERKD